MTWSSRAVTWSGLFFKVRPDCSLENGLWGGGGRGHGSLELAVPGALEESVRVWGVFWNWGEGKDWLLGSGEVTRRIEEGFVLMGWMVVPVTQKGSTG